MGLWSLIKGKGTQFRGPPAVGQALIQSLPTSEMVESCSIAGPGFVNVVLSSKWMAKV
jgi:arginyl-tRNA synthetase